MSLNQTVMLALKDKAPQLHKELAAKGTLNRYVADLADQISEESVRLTQQDRAKGHWDKLGTLECAAKMKMAHALNREVAMHDLLEFPQDATSQPKPD